MVPSTFTVGWVNLWGKTVNTDLCLQICKPRFLILPHFNIFTLKPHVLFAAPAL